MTSRNPILRARVRHRTALGAIGVISALALGACGGSSSGGSSPTTASSSSGSATGSSTTASSENIVKGGTLVLSATDPGTSIDPVTTASPTGTAVADAVSEHLTRIDLQGKTLPVLADKWSTSDKGKTWTFHLRPGVTFQDGSPLTPADVVASYERIIDPKSTSPAQSAFADLLTKVTASGDDKVVFHLTRPFSDFPALTAGSNTNILPASYKDGTWEKSPVGTGPWVLKNYNRGQSLTFTPNPTYWDKEHLYLGGLEMKLYKDAQSRVLSLQSGETDALVGEPVDAALTVALDPSKYLVKSVPDSGFTAFAMRVDEPPFNDRNVRQAVAWALDRDAIIKTVYGSAATVANDTVYGPTIPVRPEGLEQRSANADKVKELLGGKKVSFTITTSPADQTLATVAQQQLNATGSFDVKIKVLPSNEYYADGNDAPWLSAPATMTYWYGRPSASQFNNFLYFKNSDWNASHYSNPELERLSNEYDATTDPAKRQDLVNQIAKIEWDDVPVIITANQQPSAFIDKSVHNLDRSPGSIVYTDVWKEG